jgi:diguanylate cyclase (GGDEF)-like protein
MLSEIEKLPDALTVANNILQALNQAFQIGSDIVHISCSMGIAIYPEHGKDKNGLLKAADAAMYRAKELGRNRVEVAQGLEPAAN